jgi:hypothetical protein
MSYATESFEIKWFVREYPPSPNVNDDRRDPAGFEVVAAECTACGTEWRATRSLRDVAGKFRMYVGHMELFCPRCPNKEMIKLPPLIRAFRKAG